MGNAEVLLQRLNHSEMLNGDITLVHSTSLDMGHCEAAWNGDLPGVIQGIMGIAAIRDEEDVPQLSA